MILLIPRKNTQIFGHAPPKKQQPNHQLIWHLDDPAEWVFCLSYLRIGEGRPGNEAALTFTHYPKKFGQTDSLRAPLQTTHFLKGIKTQMLNGAGIFTYTFTP